MRIISVKALCKPFWALALSAALFSACGSSDQHSEQDKGVLKINAYTEPPSLDPRIATDMTSMQIIGMLFEGLTRFDEEGVPHLALAESYERSEDGKTYTFKLKEAFWSDGKPVTSHDVAFTLRSTLDPAFAAPYSFTLYDIKNARQVDEGSLPLEKLGVSTPDDRTIVIELEHPVAYMLQMVTGSHWFPTPSHIAERNPQWAANSGPLYVSNGPFRMKNWRHSAEIRLVPNEMYREAEKVRLNGIHLSLVQDASTELNMFEEGELHWTGHPMSIGIPNEAIPDLKASGQLHSFPVAGIYLYLLNTKKPPLTNVKIRKALSLAIDRQAIIDHITGTNERPALQFVAPQMGLGTGPYFKDADVATAKRLFAEGLQELGFTLETMPAISLSYNTSESHRQIAQAIQQRWYDVFGFRAPLENMEWKVYLDRIRTGEFSAGRLGWVPRYFDPMGSLEIFQYDDTGVNGTGWTSPAFQELLEKASQTLDMKRRNDYLGQAEKIIMDAMPVIPLYFYNFSYLKSDKLKGYILTPLGELDLKEAYLED